MSTKDEIMGLDEGMSSEQLDAIMMEGEEGEEELKADSNLAEEALKATASDSPAEESTEDEKVEDETTEAKEEVEEELSEAELLIKGKDSKIAAVKHENRDLAIENARMKGELDARKSMQAESKAEPVKSPLDIAMEKEGVDDPDDLQKPYSVMQEQNAWQKEQDLKASAATQQETANSVAVQAEKDLQTGDLSAEKMGVGLDLRTVAGIGEQYLTAGDRLDIANIAKSQGSNAAMKLAYVVMTQRTLAAKNDDSKLLQNAINIKTKTVTRKTSLKTEKDVDDLTTEGDDAGGNESDEIGAKLFNFITN